MTRDALLLHVVLVALRRNAMSPHFSRLTSSVLAAS